LHLEILQIVVPLAVLLLLLGGSFQLVGGAPNWFHNGSSYNGGAIEYCFFIEILFKSNLRNYRGIWAGFCMHC
jgi:hypothetical protein